MVIWLHTFYKKYIGYVVILYFSGFKHNAVQMLYNTFTYSSIVLILLPNQYIGTGACVHKTCLGGKKMDRWKNGRTDRQMNRHTVIQEIEINRNEVWKIKKDNSANIPIDVCMLRLIMLISHKLRVDLCLTMWNAFSHWGFLCQMYEGNGHNKGSFVVIKMTHNFFLWSHFTKQLRSPFCQCTR